MPHQTYFNESDSLLIKEEAVEPINNIFFQCEYAGKSGPLVY